MSLGTIAHVFGALFLVTGGAMLIPAIVSIIFGVEGDLFAFLISAAFTLVLGFVLRFSFKSRREPTLKDAIFIAVFGWILISAVSSLPFIIHGAIPSFTDAFFEMMSGYTTTGATILTDIEALPRGLVFWRSETHFIGGMGFLTLTLMFLPHGMGSLRIFRAESSPGQAITKEKITARNRDAMIILWILYSGLNLVQIALQCGGGMSLFDSVCHAFGTISTGGFSPYNRSLGHYDSAYFEWVGTVFMFLGGVNFILLFHAIHLRYRPVRENTELHWYLGFTAVFCGLASLLLWTNGTYGFSDALRYGVFQVLSLMTTTGFATADYEIWPMSVQMLLYAVCFVGACTGSTASGIKTVHYAIIWKFTRAVIRKMFVQPLSVMTVRVNRRLVDMSIVTLAACYFIANIFLVLAGGCLMTLTDNMDMTTAMSSVIATLMNIGPGFGDIGPTENYAHISAAGKWFLSFAMLVGRLDMFTALVVFYPSFWKE